MGQKVHPHGFRVGIIREWSSKWYANSKDFSKFLLEDHEIRTYLKKELYQSRISEIVIERTTTDVKVVLYTAKPGQVLGKSGAKIDELKAKLEKKIGKRVSINIIEIKKPDLNAQVVAENIAQQLEKRISFRKAMKQAIQRARKAGAKGIKTIVSGRLGGAEMARTEFYKEGNVPLQTIRADIDYGFAEANTTYGKIGVKVLIYKGEILESRRERAKKALKKDFKKNTKKPVKKSEVKEVSDNAINA